MNDNPALPVEAGGGAASWSNPSDAMIVFERIRDAAVSEQEICVAVSAKAQATHLLACLSAVHAQTYHGLELVLVEEYPHPHAGQAEAWLVAHAARFGRVLRVCSAQGQGLAEMRNAAFAHARASQVFVLSADDEIYPRCISRLADAMLESGCEAAYVQSVIADETLRLGDADIWQQDVLAVANYIGASALISKLAWREVGGYTPLAGGDTTHDFWCKFVEHGFSGAFVPEMLCRSRRDEAAAGPAGSNIEMLLRHPWLKS